MNAVDIKTHWGTVTESGHDMTLAVLVDGVADEPLNDVPPAFVGPVRWRPGEGDRVVVLERMGQPLKPETKFAWLGWDPDEDDVRLTPEWLDAGKVHILSEDGDVHLVLEDEADPFALPTDPARDPKQTDGRHLRLGVRTANEPVVLGAVWREQMRAVLDELAAAAQKLADTAETLANASWPVPPGTFTAPAGGGAISGSSAAAPPGADVTTFNAVKARADQVVAALTDPGGLKETLDDALSEFVFVGKQREGAE